jgi:4-diphosphocytidyl-2-C-methyl-D-erythritol kinase
MEQITKTQNGILVRAPAKINLSLLIAGKRPDGFHDIETLMAKIDLYDELLIEPADSDGIQLSCTGPYKVSAGRDNLVYQACKKIYQAVGLQPKVKITLTKNIPVGAGLGGGSSDAAAALIGIKKFANIKISDKKLTDLAADLGSDVPFFLGPALAFCTGRGEKNQKIEKIFPFRAILLFPDVSVSTKRVYENYSHDEGQFELLSHQIIANLKEKNIDLIATMCANMLEASCFDLYRDLADLKSRIELLGIERICLSGSGSTMYRLFTGADKRQDDSYQLMLSESIDCKCIIVNNNRW